MRYPIALCLVLACGTPLLAESLMDNIKSGAASAADAVAKGTQGAGKLIEKGAQATQDAIASTNELVRDEETPAQTRAKLDTMEADVMARLLSENEDAQATLEQSAGYAAFDMRQVTIFPLSGGYGRGVAVPQDAITRTYMQMGTGGVGAAFGIGGFVSQFVIMFETPADFERFVTHGYDAGADAGVMQGDERTTEKVQFTQGKSVFVLGKKGWRVNANASGTRYWPDEDLN